MEKNFKSRFMPNVKFKIYSFLKELRDINSDFIKISFNSHYWAATNKEGVLFVPDETIFDSLEEVSIYEAIPEFIPDGMRYSKEFNKLVPNVVSAADEYCSGTKIEFEKVIEYTEEKINQRENGFIKADLKKVNYSLVDPFAYEDLGKCLTLGAEKYDINNWKKGDLATYISALERHLSEIKKFVSSDDKQYLIDKDTGLQHGANLFCNAMFIHYFIKKELEC